MLHGDLASLLGELGGVVAVQRASLAPKVTLAKKVKVAAGVARKPRSKMDQFQS